MADGFNFSVNLTIPREFIREYFDGLARSTAAAASAPRVHVLNGEDDRVISDILDSGVIEKVLEAITKNDVSDEEEKNVVPPVSDINSKNQSEKAVSTGKTEPTEKGSSFLPTGSMISNAVKMTENYIGCVQDPQEARWIQGKLMDLAKLNDSRLESMNKSQSSNKDTSVPVKESKETKDDASKKRPAYQETGAPVMPAMSFGDSGQLEDIMKMVGPMMQNLMGPMLGMRETKGTENKGVETKEEKSPGKVEETKEVGETKEDKKSSGKE
jgi:hypothetical protein